MGPTVERIQQVIRLSEIAERIAPTQSGEARELLAIAREEMRDLAAIPKTKAAQVLEVSEETIDAWLAQGILQRVRGETTYERIDPASLLGAKLKLDRLRQQGLSPRLVLRVMRGPAPSHGPNAARRQRPAEVFDEEWFALNEARPTTR